MVVRFWQLKLFGVVAVLALSTGALARQVMPKGDTAVAVRRAADSHSESVGTLKVGEAAVVLDEVPRWWKVQLSDGTTGFVGKASTTLADAGPADGSGGGSGRSGATATGEGWNTFAGYPTCVRTDCQFEVLEKHDFAVGYSETRRDPLWVAYHLFPTDHPHDDPRLRHFSVDEATTARVNEKCYKVPPHETNPFDKGHNAPNGAIDGRMASTPNATRFSCRTSARRPRA